MTIEDLSTGSGERFGSIRERFSSWRQRLLHPELVRQYQFPSQKNLLKNLAVVDENGNRFDFDGTPMGGEKFTRDPLPGYLNVVIEYHRGGLEAVYQRYMQDIRDQKEDPRYEGILTVGVADISETGGSLHTAHLAEILEVLQCPPVALTFKYNPRQALPNL